MRAVLRNPALRRVMGAFLLFNATVYGTWVAILLYAYEATGPASVGIVAVVQLLPAAGLAPVAASLADRVPRERILLGGYIAQAVTFGATAASMLLGWPAPITYVLAAAGAIATTLTRPTQGALLPALSRTPDELTAANGLAGAVEGVGVMLGPLAGALILAAAPPGVVWAAGAVSFVAATVLVAGRSVHGGLMPVGDHTGETEPGAETPIVSGQPAALMIGGLRALTGNRDTRLLVGLLGVRMLTSGALDVLFVLLALEVLDTGNAGAGFLTAALGVGTVLAGATGVVLVGRRQLAPAMALGALVFGIALAVAAIAGSTWLVPMLVAAGGVGFAAIDITGRTVLQRVTPDRMLARVLGTLEGVGLLAVAVGSVLVPIIVSVLGVRASLAVVAGLLPAAVALAWRELRRIDRHAHVPLRELRLLRRSSIFAPLPPPQLESVARRTRWVSLDPGSLLIRQGDTGDRFYVLESGSLVVSIDGVPIRTIDQPGDGVGEIALLRNVPRTATVISGAPAVLLSLERHDFLEAVTGHEVALAAGLRSADTRLAGRIEAAVDASDALERPSDP
jgi:MFS family permease